MSDIDLTPEETAALQEMQNEPVALEEPTPEPSVTPAEPVQAEATPVAAPEGAPAQDPAQTPEFKSTRAPEKPPHGWVPHQALHEARFKTKEVSEENRVLKERIDALEKANQSPPPEYVDPLEDPEGYRRYDEYTRNQMKEALEKQQMAAQQQAAMQHRRVQAEQFEAEFTKTTPDYQQAAQFLHQQRINELRSMGYGDQEVMQQLGNDANAIFDAGQRTGINPAHLIYLRAQEAGYTKPQAAPAPQPDAASEASKMEALAKAEAQTRGIGTAGGAENAGKLTVKQLSAMSEAELSKVSPEQIEAAMMG